MKIEELPPDTKEKLDALMALVTRALEEAGVPDDDEEPAPHLTAVSQSSMPDGIDGGVLQGGSVVAPSPPPFGATGAKAIKNLHRDVLKSGGGVLNTIILRARRDAVGSPWSVTAKLVSRPEYAALVAKRKPIDDRVAELLREHAADQKLEWIAYGRVNRHRPNRLGLVPRGGDLLVLDPDPRLGELFNEAEHLYQSAGLEPTVLDWTLQGGKTLEVTDYFE